MTRPDRPDLPTDVDLDPDPTPTATAWQEYLAAAQSLDAVRREAAAADAAATRVASSARAELAQLTARLEQQRTQLTGAATRTGVPPPRLAPTSAEVVAAAGAGPAALERCRQLVEAADRELPGGGSRGGWPPPRWLLGGAVPLGIAVVLACVALVLLFALR